MEDGETLAHEFAHASAVEEAWRRATRASTAVCERAKNSNVHAPSLYLDTSVIGGYFDSEFMADTRALWELREAGRFRFVSSELVIDEIAGAPERVRELLRTSFAVEDVLEVNEEMEELAAAYMAQKSCRPHLPMTRSM